MWPTGLGPTSACRRYRPKATVRPCWDAGLTFPYLAQPVAFGNYTPIMLSARRAFPPGGYEARVAARQAATWDYDEAVFGFTMP